MHLILTCLFLLFVTPVIQGWQWQKWTGTFSTDVSPCNRNVCCCLSENIVLTWSPGTLHAALKFAGQCGSLTSLAVTTPYPAGLTTSLSIGPGQPTQLTLSSDSLTIIGTSPINPVCNGRARRISWLPCFYRQK
ncbi:unnamed protein product [Adineta steineri]|uniref:Uncharacterized protein n=1 Tax=Adineta steineri TaxID=433720 RepID=A0A814FWN0_9BILA|nr:unnamed protein product [Adineta steineri]CAF0992923.1 unnamed protein product [Adineta steineri]